MVAMRSLRGDTVRAGVVQEVIIGDMDVVSALRAALAARIGQGRFELWFGADHALRLDGDTLHVVAPSPLLADWIRANFRSAIREAGTEVLGFPPTLEFCAEASKSAQPVSDARDSAVPRVQPAPRCPVSSAPLPGTPMAEPASAGAIVPSGEEAPARPRFASFETFVSGESNRLAWASAMMVAREVGRITPLFLHGPTGVGKTHLLQAVWTSVRQARRGQRIVYLSAEQFTSFFVEAVRGGGLPSFRAKCRDVDVLILDDIHFLADKQSTKVEFLHTVDALLRGGRQLVVSADRPLAELADLGPELSSRLQSGMVCPIDPPDCVTRLGIVCQLAKRAGIELTDELCEWVATRWTSNARELSGVVWRVEATQRVLGRSISPGEAERALADLLPDSQRPVALGDIEKAVCGVLGLDPGSLQAEGKARSLSHSRMLAMYLARKHTRAALSEIGAYFGKRSHSTVVSAQHRVDGWLTDGKPVELADARWRIDEAIRKIEHRLMA